MVFYYHVFILWRFFLHSPVFWFSKSKENAYTSLLFHNMKVEKILNFIRNPKKEDDFFCICTQDSIQPFFQDDKHCVGFLVEFIGWHQDSFFSCFSAHKNVIIKHLLIINFASNFIIITVFYTYIFYIFFFFVLSVGLCVWNMCQKRWKALSDRKKAKCQQKQRRRDKSMNRCLFCKWRTYSTERNYCCYIFLISLLVQWEQSKGNAMCEQETMVSVE